MPDRELPARPSVEQYRRQARDLVRDCGLGRSEALARVRRVHPRYHRLPESDLPLRISRTDALLVLAREHGFESWPKFVHEIEMLNRIRATAPLEDPVSAFLEVACVPRHTSHASGSLDDAEMILSRYPEVGTSTIHAAATLGDEAAVRGFLARDPRAATAKVPPHGWDALTHLCFSRYLRLDPARSERFVRTARALLDGGADARTGWSETIDRPNPRLTWESAIYGAAGIARHAELTRLLLEHGADPNDEETPYHVPESNDNSVMTVLLESGRLSQASLACMLARKADWHDEEGLRLLLDHGADPRLMTAFGVNALHQALRRDNSVRTIGRLLEHGADPAIRNKLDGRSGFAMAARRGRGDVLSLFRRRGMDPAFEGLDALAAACAEGDRDTARSLAARSPDLVGGLAAEGGALLAEFAGNGNLDGVRILLDLGVSVSAAYGGDPYFEIPPKSSALHVAAWRAQPAVVEELVRRGAPVDARDGKGRTPMALAVKACVDSHWIARRSPESVKILLEAGASPAEVAIPCGYGEVDELVKGRGV